MINEQYINLVTAYLEGSISDDQRSRLNRLIADGEIDVIDLKEMELLYEKMDKLPEPEPSDQMRDRFYAMLGNESNHASSPWRDSIGQWWQSIRPLLSTRRLAFAAGIFLLGMFTGNWATPFQNYRQQLTRLSGEVSQMREVMMLTLLDNSSATERLKAVNISTDIQPADGRIVQALLKTLNEDSNVNVRLAAVEALIRHASNPAVRSGLVNSIQHQSSPQVQVALADAMLALREKQSVRELRDLLQQKDLDPNVRDKVQHTITALI